MGTWGPGIFSDDVACDVRIEYRSLLEDGVKDDAAADLMIEQWREEQEDPDEGPTFWIALALSQSKLGRLREDIKERALIAIAAGPDERWRQSGSQGKRAAALAKAKSILTGPQPPRKKVHRPWRHETTLVPGDVLALEENNTCILVRVVKIDDSRTQRAPIMMVLDYEGSKVPSPRKIAKIEDRPPRLIPSGLPERGKLRYVPGGAEVLVTRRRDPDFAEVGFSMVANIRPRKVDDDLIAGSYFDGWELFADHLRFQFKDRDGSSAERKRTVDRIISLWKPSSTR